MYELPLCDEEYANSLKEIEAGKKDMEGIWKQIVLSVTVNMQNFSEVRCTVGDLCDQTKSRMYLKTSQKQ